MKRSAVAAAALVGVSALGASVLPGSAASDSTTTSGMQTNAMQTKRWVLRETAANPVGPRSGVSTDVIRSRVTGKIVGYDSGVARFYPRQDRIVWQVAFALKGGIIVARLNVNVTETQHTGRILSGTGKYRGIEGTMTSRQRDRTHTLVTLHYQL